MGDKRPVLPDPDNWFSGEPTIRREHLQVLRIPPDGSPPHLFQVNIVDAMSEENFDSLKVNVPDFRPYWGPREGFRWRDMARMEVRGHGAKPELNGTYLGWKSFSLDLAPVSEKTGFCGNAFIVKLPLWEFDDRGKVYEDFPDGFVDSEFWEPMLQKMRDQ